MSDSKHMITFNQAQPGTPGAQPLHNLIGTSATCPTCGASVPVTASDVAAYTSTHGQPQPTALLKAVAEHARGPVQHGTGPLATG